MELEQRHSGLVVPKARSEPPSRQYGLLEIKDEERRAIAKEALSLLWDAMDLSRGSGGIVLKNDAHKTHYQIYRIVGEMLLGDECPEKEQLT